MEGRKHYCLPQENIIWKAEAFSCVEQSSTHIINWSFCHIISCRKKNHINLHKDSTGLQSETVFCAAHECIVDTL